jgi:tetratricopeptide (TPR) repeat protein
MSIWTLAVAMPKVKAAARRAIELNPRSDVARAALGRVHLFYDWDWKAAEEQFQKAIDLNPNSSDGTEGWLSSVWQWDEIAKRWTL